MLSASDLFYMRDTQKAHMPDIACVLVYAAGTVNEYNEQDAPSYITSSPVICGIEMQLGSERKGADMTVVEYDAIARLPLLTAIKENDRFEIISRFGELIDPITFEVVSPIQRGPSGVRLLLRKIVT